LKKDKQKYEELKSLYNIAVLLNKVADLNAVLSLVLKETIDLLKMETGWIWLLHPATNSVFLAASHNLPKAFTDHPERLSGWCYCIEKYLENNLEFAANISEITCTRLKDLDTETDGLKYHATLPLYDKERKIGLLNIVSKNSGQLSDHHLELLRSIGDLLSGTFERTSLFEKSKETGILEERNRLANKFKSNIIEQIENLDAKLKKISEVDLSSGQIKELKEISENIKSLSHQNLNELKANPVTSHSKSKIKYPVTPITKREMEVLNLLKEGKTNRNIGEELFISERTVKFHVSILLSKLNAKNRTDAVQIALKRGIVSI